VRTSDLIDKGSYSFPLEVEDKQSPTLDLSIERSITYLLGVQNNEHGFWVDELEADSTITSEYIMLRFFLGQLDTVRKKRAVAYLRDSQLPEGGWNIFYGAPSNVSASVKAYFALKLCGVSQNESFMIKAREMICRLGSIHQVNVFTKISLSLFGQYDWKKVPYMPPEIFLLPQWFYFNLKDISYWSRAVLVPLLIIFGKKHVCVVPPHAQLNELYPESPDQMGKEKTNISEMVSWKNFFIVLDKCMKVCDRFHIRPLRKKAIEAAHQWMVKHMRGEGGLGAIYPAMANSIFALRSLGYPRDHPLIQKALGEIEALEVGDERAMRLQPCFSPIWDTSLTMITLLETGLARDHQSIIGGAEWLIKKQVSSEGDWKDKVSDGEPGGWYFQFENEFYPDTDDTAVVLMALCKSKIPNEKRRKEELIRGLRWFLKMQGSDGGWGSYDRDNNKHILNNIPFADHGALLDPSTSDLTGRGLEILGLLGFDQHYPPARKAIQFLKKEQEKDGSWYGRWGVNYIYGTWSALSGLRVIGEDLNQTFIQSAVRWLITSQNPDGGWGESCESYADRSLAGVGNSTVSQTSWALMGLMQAGEVESPEVDKGVRFLVQSQGEGGFWNEQEFTGTGFPKVFYLRYHMYSKYFPVWALAQYRSLKLTRKILSDRVREENLRTGIFKHMMS